MNLTVTSAPHIRSGNTTQRTMLDVLIALVPALIAGVVLFGLRALVLTVISAAGCVVAELIVNLVMRKKPAVGDLSAVVTGVLLAFSLPASCPYWVVLVGDAFAIIVVKGFMGGLGQNVFNPALGGRAVIMLFWPATITRYTTEAVPAFNFGAVDIVSSSTPLQTMARPALPDASLLDMFLGRIGGCIGEVCTLALLIGLVYLLWRKVISWRIPVAYIGAVAVLTLVFNKGDDAFLWMLYSVMGGGVMLGAIFMATDYSTSPMTVRGGVIFAVGIGLITMLIRLWGAYPEGMSFAILIMNSCVPLINKYVKPKRFGVK